MNLINFGNKIQMADKKTHKVIDLVYHEDEGNDVFAGSFKECHDWKLEQGFGYQIVPMTKEEMKIYNEEK